MLMSITQAEPYLRLKMSWTDTTEYHLQFYALVTELSLTQPQTVLIKFFQDIAKEITLDGT